MKKTMKTEALLSVYRLLSAAKCGKMDDADKIKIWKIQRAMKPVAVQFEDDVKSANEKLRPDEFDKRIADAKKIEDAERESFGEISTRQREREFVDMLSRKYKDYAEFQAIRANYVALCNEAVRDYADKDVELDFEPLSEDAFAKFISSNDLTLGQITLIADAICDN